MIFGSKSDIRKLEIVNGGLSKLVPKITLRSLILGEELVAEIQIPYSDIGVPPELDISMFTLAVFCQFRLGQM